jgi:ribose transport system substrate-binding protein
MGVFKRIGVGLAVSVALLSGGPATHADEVINDPFRAPALDALHGKTIAYLPISIGFDLAQAWGGVIKQQAQTYGMKFTSQDPNWNTGAMVQGFTALLAAHPDVIVTQNPDMQSLARLMKQANQQGIVVVQMNMAGAVQTDGVVAPDFIGLGEAIANKVVEKCGANTKTSHKVAIVQGVLTGGVSFYQVQGFNKVFPKHPEIKIVSSQAADWDASKARAITETALQQNPDMCAVIDVWDGQGVGTGAAIKQAGLSNKVFFITSGGGAQSMCDKLKDGTFSAVYDYDAVGMGRDAWTAIMVALQNKKGAGAIKTQIYSPYRYMTKADVKDGTCFNPEEYAKILR